MYLEINKHTSVKYPKLEIYNVTHIDSYAYYDDYIAEISLKEWLELNKNNHFFNEFFYSQVYRDVLRGEIYARVEFKVFKGKNKDICSSDDYKIHHVPVNVLDMEIISENQ